MILSGEELAIDCWWGDIGRLPRLSTRGPASTAPCGKKRALAGKLRQEGTMIVYRNSKLHSYESDGLYEPLPCEVRIGEGMIAVSYQGEGGLVLYEGREEGPGHFRLAAQGVNGRATLHRFENDNVLDGWWLEDSYEGMWRIELNE
jgi:hypothetical protein